jgi:magnesium and cobalt exporter, CNNM family
MDESFSYYHFLIVAFVLLLNGFFASAEVALLSVRRSKLRQMAAEGQAGAKAALSLLANPERLLSVVQVGVTLASLALGWAGEGTLFQLFSSMLAPFATLTPGAEGVLHGLSFALTFMVMTYAHVVIGEVVPKNLAIERSSQLAVIVAPALLLFYKICSPFVFVIERSAGGLSRVLGLKGTLGGGHSAEELKFIISASRRQGHVDSFEEVAISRMLDLQDHLTREIMVPRSEIVSLPVDSSMDDVLNAVAEHHFSRIPVYEEEPEHIIGLVHIKDLITIWQHRRRANEKRERVPKFDLRLQMTEPFVVPETKPVNQLIDEFREKHVHMAIVVDEFGTVVGLVTLEDVIEQIFGEIEDEHDEPVPAVESEATDLELDGGINILDLATKYEIELAVDAGFETLAGFLLSRLGHIPEPGAEVLHGGYRFKVIEMEKNRLTKVRVERLADDELEASSEEPG